MQTTWTDFDALFLIASLVCFAARRAISGMKNAAFYGKGRPPELLPSWLKKWIKNIHFLETPAWYTQAGGTFFAFLVLAGRSGYGFWGAVGIALLAAMSASALSSPFYQGPINVSVGKPYVDRDENRKSEFAWGPISFWWPRPWFGYVRIFSAVAGAGGIAWTVVLLV